MSLPTEQLIYNGELFLAWKKVAMEGPAAMPMEAGTPTPAQGAPADVTEAAMPEQGMADTQMALARVLTGLISHELRMQLAYLFYAETMRGAGRGELAELFREHAKSELEDATYLLQKLSVLVPGGAPIPPPVSPDPMTDPQEVLAFLIEQEERAIAYLRSLHALVGEDPMKYTLEQMMADEATHADRLSQFLEAAPEATTIPETTLDAPPEDVAVEATPAAAEPAPKEPKAEKPKAESKPEKSDKPEPKTEVKVKTADDVSDRNKMTAATNEPIEAYLLRTQAQQIQQHQAELEATRAELEATQQMASAASMQAEEAQASSQQLQAQLEEANAAAAEASQASAQAVEQAAMAEENAAQQAVAKMDLSMRIQQMRQMLADMAASDPVAEEGLGFGTQAGPGTPQTAMQQQMAAQQAAMMDPTGGTGQAPTAEAAQQQEEAVNAQGEAQKQTAQAQEASSKPKSESSDKKDGTQVTVKTSSLADLLFNKTSGMVDRAIGNAAHTAGAHATHAGVETLKAHAREFIAAHKDKLQGAAAATGLLGVAGVARGISKDRREERMADALDRLAVNSDLQRMTGGY